MERYDNNIKYDIKDFNLDYEDFETLFDSMSNEDLRNYSFLIKSILKERNKQQKLRDDFHKIILLEGKISNEKLIQKINDDYNKIIKFLSNKEEEYIRNFTKLKDYYIKILTK